MTEGVFILLLWCLLRSGDFSWGRNDGGGYASSSMFKGIVVLRYIWGKMRQHASKCYKMNCCFDRFCRKSLDLLQDDLRRQEVPYGCFLNSGMCCKFRDGYKSWFALVIFLPDILQHFPCCTGTSAGHFFYIACINNEARTHLFRQNRHKRQ